MLAFRMYILQHLLRRLILSSPDTSWSCCCHVTCYLSWHLRTLQDGGAVVKGVEHISTIVCLHLGGAGSSPAGSVGRDLNLQKLNYRYLSTSVAVVLVVR